jgi:hypothetical protein
MDTYVGLHQDKHGLIPETEDCAGWELGRMRVFSRAQYRVVARGLSVKPRP